ncbi:regulatory protein MerR [Isosphaera pallida ATCC 43644]|uniref:Regulatory protein MerR n=1 Tax=Isosphaera pallida (strain ATCC 43644 / DSM 9630 / IS1B) TaxID=575540 RepID=E8R292_ISOPI|nr:MerR family transcriptional regulator [Isosphaera pallida]ADV63522.1 regulatory protein MerR [Isosphaera pallida ATCC 43644]
MTDDHRPRYTIAAVSKLTGINCHTLRVWEKRYGYPRPARSPTGQRRYDDDQVRGLIRASHRVKRGEPPRIVLAEVRLGRLDPSWVVTEPHVRAASELIDRLDAGDPIAAMNYLDSYQSDPWEQLRILEVALTEIGERWYRRDTQIFQEHFASGFIRHKLAGMIETARQRNHHPNQLAVLATLSGERHEGGILAVAVALELQGWRAIYLGPDLPIDQLRGAVTLWKPQAALLSFTLSRNLNAKFRELGTIREIPIFVGGRSIVNHQRLARSRGLIPMLVNATEMRDPFLRELDLWTPSRPPCSEEEAATDAQADLSSSDAKSSSDNLSEDRNGHDREASAPLASSLTLTPSTGSAQG